MTLTTRLLVFHLSSLAVLLTGFSATLYGLARGHLYARADERLEAALNTLSAAVEVGPDGVEWEPGEHALRFAPGAAQDRTAWVVADAGGRVVAGSERAAGDDLGAAAAGRFPDPSEGTRRFDWRGERWQAGQRRIVPGGAAAPPHEPHGKDATEVKYSSLVVTAALPLESTSAALRQLLAVLAGVSLGVLAVALVAGRAVCRRALRPVRRMAADARAADPADPDRRIATPAGGDELTDLAAAFNGLLDRLNESVQRQGRFTGDASHQLRTPLAALLGQVEIALRRERTADEYRRALTAAHSQGVHLQRIVEALLYLARADAEAAAPGRERLDLAEWLPAHLATRSDHPRVRDVRVVGTEKSIPVACHPVLLGEIVNILLDNACRYSPAGSAVTLTLSLADGSARLEVADRGPGIAADDLRRLFTPFFRTRDALRANRGGVGLGLCIARRLAQALGGAVDATSRPGDGSRFFVTLPVAPQGAVT